MFPPPISDLPTLQPQIPAMAKCGKKGSIIVNSSVMGSRVCAMMPGGGVYSATKAGADMLMKYAAVEVSPSGDVLVPDDMCLRNRCFRI